MKGSVYEKITNAISNYRETFYQPHTAQRQLLYNPLKNLENFRIRENLHDLCSPLIFRWVFIDFLLTVKATTLIFISGRGSAVSSAKQGKSGSIYNFVKNK